MILNIKDRLYFSSILPEGGSFFENIAIDSLAKKLAFSDEELNKIKIKPLDSGGVTWDSSVEVEVEVEFNVSEKEMLKTIFEKLDSKKEIKREMMGLFTKIKQEIG